MSKIFGRLFSLEKIYKSQMARYKPMCDVCVTCCVGCARWSARWMATESLHMAVVWHVLVAHFSL